MSQDVAIYCVCFPQHEPIKKKKYQKNIMCNAAGISDEYRSDLSKRGFIFDDTGDNISELNWTLGDLTATYWIWKNSDHEVVGTSQYRRFWDKCTEKMLFEENTFYVQDPIVLPQNLKEQFILCHGESGISFLDELSKTNRIPLTQQMLDKTYALKYVHGCNMFIAHKEIYNKVCEILFDIVFEIHEKYGDDIKALEPFNRRLPAFLAERVLTALIVHKDHFFPDLKIATIKWKQVKPSRFKRYLGKISART